MSVIIAMTGLTAAQHDLSVTSNNIANVGTTGFHSSRADFGDIYAQSPYTVARTQTGRGTQLLSVTSNFAQGAVEQTSNTLDLAIEGQGFFIKKSDLENGQSIYSRSGGFGLNEDGFVVDSMGSYLMSRQVSENGEVLAATMDDLAPVQIPMMAGEPKATETMEMSVNFSSNPAGIGNQAAIPPIAPFNFLDDTTYAKRTPLEILDDQGQPRAAYAFFVQTAEPTPLVQETSFEMHLVIDDDIYASAAPAEVTFNEFGMPAAPITPFTFSRNGVDFGVSLEGSVLTNANYKINSFQHDGESKKGLANLQVDESGLIWATYMGDDAISLGKVAMANFNNPHGLKRLGNASYIETLDSGRPIMGEADTNGFGNIRASALEGSNVELTGELVNLITAQRNYQANAKALETSTSLAQTILNMRT